MTSFLKIAFARRKKTFKIEMKDSEIILFSHSAQVVLTVLGRPSMPQDRLLVSNINKNGCRLTWQAPQDDGGLPVEYIIEKFVVEANAW